MAFRSKPAFQRRIRGFLTSHATSEPDIVQHFETLIFDSSLDSPKATHSRQFVIRATIRSSETRHARP
jgi:hypothetical protein